MNDGPVLGPLAHDLDELLQLQRPLLRCPWPRDLLEIFGFLVGAVLLIRRTRSKNICKQKKNHVFTKYRLVS